MKIQILLWNFMKDVSPISEGDRNEIMRDADKWFNEETKIPEGQKKPEGFLQWLGFVNNHWVFRAFNSLLYTPAVNYWRNLGLPQGEIEEISSDDFKELLK